MSIEIEKIKREFLRIKALGFVKSNRPNNKDGGIGNTYEDYLGVIENNIKGADYEGFEIKSQRELTGSYISLFTKSPTAPKQANRYLKDTFGRGDTMFPDLKSLHSSMFGDRWNNLYQTYKLKLSIDRINKKIVLFVNDSEENLLSDIVCWDFDALVKSSKKISSLFVVFASSKKIDGEEYFHFNRAIIYHKFDFNKFLNLLENGYIMFDVRIGVYKTGKNIGKPHDHGSGFRIKRENIDQLYDEVIEI